MSALPQAVARPLPHAEAPPAVELAGWGGCTTWRSAPQGRIASTRLQFSGMYCAACTGVIETALLHEPGVVSASLQYAGRRGTLDWDPVRTDPGRLLAAVARAGYGVVPDLPQPARILRQREARAALWCLFVAAFCMSQVMMYTAPFYFAAPGTLEPDQAALLLWAAWLLTLPVLLFSARPFFDEAWRGLRQGQVRMELPVALGIGVSFLASSMAAFGTPGQPVYFDSLTMFVCFLLAGRWLALRAQDRVAGALEDATARLPHKVRRLRMDGTAEQVEPEALRIGDRLLVLAGEAFAADGPLLEGATEVDEALLTGESHPVSRQVGDEAIAGSINLGAPVIQRASRLGDATRYAGIAALLQQSLTQRPALLSAADRVARPFLWAVLLLAGLAALVWHSIDPSRALPVAVAVLVVTCPCALSLAAPSALLSAAGGLARRGILVQRLDALQALAAIDTIFFDKTGTLTQDHLSATELELAPAAYSLQLASTVLGRAAALAGLSTHPAARAVAAYAAAAATGVHHESGATWTAVREIPGRGVEALDEEGRRWRLGAHAWVSDAVTTMVAAGPAVWIGCDGLVVGCLPLVETVRPDARQALDRLRADDISLALLSGDGRAQVAHMADRMGMARAWGGATPEDKLARITAEQAAGHRVGMVGDGVNDAPVLARADVSFSFAHGAALAQSKADFILLSPRLADVAVARRVARRAMRIVWQNLAWAAGYNALCVPLALLGLFPPWAAGLGMAASSLGVLLNALRAGRIAADAV
ncbi:MAG: heavy metal translocating P-type ATPase [Pseudomonadota bacterium]